MSERSQARVEFERHQWTGPHDAGWYCVGCGITWTERTPPPPAGCAPFCERVRRAQERPTGTTRQYLTELLREAVERLERQAQWQQEQEAAAADLTITPPAPPVPCCEGDCMEYLGNRGVLANEPADLETVVRRLEARLDALQQTLRVMEPWAYTPESGDARCFFCGAVGRHDSDRSSAVHTSGCVWANLHPEVRREGYDPCHAALGPLPHAS